MRHVTNHTSNQKRMSNVCVNDKTDEVIILFIQMYLDVSSSIYFRHPFILQQQKWSVLPPKGVVGFIFELLFYICPKSSSSMRICFSARNLYNMVLIGSYLVLWQWTSAVLWNKSLNDVFRESKGRFVHMIWNFFFNYHHAFFADIIRG